MENLKKILAMILALVLMLLFGIIPLMIGFISSMAVVSFKSGKRYFESFSDFMDSI